MLEAIENLGGLAIEENPNDFLSAITLDLPKEKNGKKQHLIRIYFDTRSDTISVAPKQIDDGTKDEYLWVGNADGAMSPQWYFTTTNVEYLLSQTIPNYIDILDDPVSRKKFEVIRDKFYYDLGGQQGSRKRYRYVFNVEKYGLATEGWIKDTYMDEDKGQDAKKMVSEVKKVFMDWVKKETNLTDKEIALFTLIVDGKPLVKDDEYQRLVIRKKVEDVFEGAEDGVCSICSEEKKVTDNTTKFKLKYYMTDKKGFSSNVSGRFIKNFPICQECYTKVLVGEAYTMNRMGTRIAGLDLYVIPDILFKPDVDIFNIDEWSSYIKNSFNTVVSKKGLEDFERSLKGYIDYENFKNNYILNLLFYERNQAEFKVLKLIKDVPPSRIDLIKKRFGEVETVMNGIMGEDMAWHIDLDRIYHLIPLKSTQRDIEYRKLLELYDEIFSDKMVSYQFLVGQAVEMSQVYYFNEFGQYNVSLRGDMEWDTAFSYVILQENILMDGLRRLGILEIGGRAMDYSTLNVDEKTKEFLQEMKYDEPKTAMFLFGNLIAEIASAQRRDGKKNKPILNKLNYQGMSWSKIQRLTGEVFEKLRQYDVLKYNEQKWAECIRLFDMTRSLYDGKWPLNDRENIYYILSGYGFATVSAIKRGGNNQNDTEEVTENEQQ
ncbi:TIGR02556 family CRISPR-associated protein [Calorimonas adulescens]|uniref:TIGR02556 family CRISPR-associated protein n=1 Tax=Calorimonas adulescens TaxID=2606906 RepID=A0A5D8QE82_9THEO|nr:TIGR02556 family CRISPR-associated protein [Calorimonas adulescens]TZE82821.1 TIGR02556 family CRISPR-associated protein [Calorimonas adulescens]